MTKQEAALLLDHVVDSLVGDTKTVDQIVHAAWMGSEALRASEPRVLTIEEIKNLNGQYPLYIEFKNKIDDHRHDTGWIITTETTRGLAISCLYNIARRCWSWEPTSDQMQATPWKESETE